MAKTKKWETPAELDLCMAVITTSGAASNYKWTEIHAIMSQLGHAFSKDAISQHFTKTILRGFRNRHGMGPGKLAEPLPAAGKRKAEDNESGAAKKQKTA